MRFLPNVVMSGLLTLCLLQAASLLAEEAVQAPSGDELDVKHSVDASMSVISTDNEGNLDLKASLKAQAVANKLLTLSVAVKDADDRSAELAEALLGLKYRGFRIEAGYFKNASDGSDFLPSMGSLSIGDSVLQTELSDMDYDNRRVGCSLSWTGDSPFAVSLDVMNDGDLAYGDMAAAWHNADKSGWAGAAFAFYPEKTTSDYSGKEVTVANWSGSLFFSKLGGSFLCSGDFAIGTITHDYTWNSSGDYTPGTWLELEGRAGWRINGASKGTSLIPGIETSYQREDPAAGSATGTWRLLGGATAWLWKKAGAEAKLGIENADGDVGLAYRLAITGKF